jgi:hypothetical protein
MWLVLGEKRNEDVIFVGKLEGKTEVGRHRSRWDGNVKFTLK